MDNFPNFSLLNDPLYAFIVSPQYEMDSFPKTSSEWSFEENKLFEDALAEFDTDSLEFFHSLASRVPWKSVDDVKSHYRALVNDVELIETGNVPVPDYEEEGDNNDENDEDFGFGVACNYGVVNGTGPHEQSPVNRTNRGGPQSPIGDPKGKSNNGAPRRRGVPWTEEEHQLFLMGLNKYGKGDWRSISRYYVITKTPTQVASHAQKYFRRQASSTPADRRRPSIHDIQNVNPPALGGASASLTHRNVRNTTAGGGGLMAVAANNIFLDEPVTFSANLNGGIVGGAGGMLFPAANSVNFQDLGFVNQSGGAGGYDGGAYMLPYLRNQKWG